MKLRSRLTLLTITLLVLLPALAVLQYRWVGQLGDAARERMQRNLHNAAQQFRDSFDTELARVFVSLQVDSALSAQRYAERYAAWASTTAYPWLVANVYVVDAPRGNLRLLRWDVATRAFAPAAWDGALNRARAHFTSELAAYQGDRRPPEPPKFREYPELVVAPLIHLEHRLPAEGTTFTSIARVFGFTVIELNLAAIRERLIPALADRHFSHTDGDAYRVAVVDAANPRSVIYRSSSDAAIDPARADVSMPIFAAHHDPVLFLTQGVLNENRDAADKRQLVVSVVRRLRNDNVAMRARLANGNEGRWLLLAQHERGSLAAAVGDVRQRNLAISFGILLLMGMSIGLLAVASRRAQRLAHQQMEFVAGVSHELRTPVAVIRSAADNLSEGVIDDPERVRRYGDAIQTEARRLGEMIERILHFAGIESGRIIRTPIEIEPLIRQAVAAAVPEAEGFTVEYQISPDLPLVLGEETAIRSAIQNLVANARKYGGPERWIGVRVETGRAPRSHSTTADRRAMILVAKERVRRGPEVRVTVEDRGPGIGAADLPHIFDPFYRGANATSQQVQGNGLGLALVQRIVQAHGGRVTVVTREGSGSAFTLHLPAAAPTTDAVPLHSPNEAAAR